MYANDCVKLFTINIINTCSIEKNCIVLGHIQRKPSKRTPQMSADMSGGVSADRIGEVAIQHYPQKIPMHACVVCVVCGWKKRERGATWLLLVGHADVRMPAKGLQVCSQYTKIQTYETGSGTFKGP